MDAATWQRLEALFAEATLLPAAQREAFCDSACGSDAALRDELRSLLASHATEASLLDAPVDTAGHAATPEAGNAAGTRIGVWRLGALIQRGGAGEVYFAARDDGAFEQRVAMKLLYRDAAADVDRFHAERQILARLDHPGIARLLDGGVTDAGRLYAVVEYVDGATITVHCSARRADFDYRLALFEQVCEAVSHAHRHLIVHRDLKPGNILVSDAGRVKLLDFGVAKQLEHSLHATVDDTRAPYTSDYAAPEQLSGGTVTTATDVYALGVLLFELLAGQRPWRGDGLPIARIVQLIVHDEAPAASSRVVAGSPVPARQLVGDLDAIIATCLRKDPSQRYASVEALQRDIAHHQAREPVAARGRARRYVLGCALRRHRWSVAAGSLIVGSLAVGLAATAWQAHRAEVERDAARRAASREEAVRYYLTNLFRSSAAQGASAPLSAKAMLDRSAQRVLREYRDDPQLAGKIVVTLTDLYGALEDVEGQAPLLEGYLAAAGPQADAESVALARQKLAYVELLRGHVPRAAELLAQAQAFWAQAPQRYREQQLESLFMRGQLLRSQNDLDGSIRTYRQAIGERIAFSGEVHRETAILYNSLAISLTAANRLDEALAAFRTTLSIYDKLGQSEDLDALVILANTGTLALRVGRLREAEQILRTAYEKQRARAGDSAAVAAAMGHYGAALTARGEAAQAIVVLETATAMAIKFAGAGSPLAVQDQLFLSDALAAAGELARARSVASENRRAAAARFGEAGLLTLRVRLGEARLRLLEGNASAAHAEFVALLEPLRASGPPGRPALAQALLGCGDALLAVGRADAALAPLREAVSLRESLQGPQSWELAQARARLGEALKSSGAAAAAGAPAVRELLQQAADTMATELGEKHPQVLRARRVLAMP